MTLLRLLSFLTSMDGSAPRHSPLMMDCDSSDGGSFQEEVMSVYLIDGRYVLSSNRYWRDDHALVYSDLPYEEHRHNEPRIVLTPY